MSKIKAVILDWAGTSIDYGCFAPVQAFKEAFHDYHLDVTDQEVREPMGLLKIDHIRTMLKMDRIQKLFELAYHRDINDQDAHNIYQLFETKLMATLETYTDVKPYVLEAVQALRAHNIKIGSTTGYTDFMMQVVVKGAKSHGYAPDLWVSPDQAGGRGRPFPYMIFQNMMALGIQDVNSVLKIGDTISDIKEGKNAGVHTIGVLEGSSEMGLRQAEYEAMNETDQLALLSELKQRYLNAGADGVIVNLSELMDYIIQLENK